MGDAAGGAGERAVSDYDVVIAGAGPTGAILAGQLGAAGKKVLVLEAGGAAGRTWADYQANVRQFLGTSAKVPNSPYAQSAGAPFPSVLDISKLQPGGPPDDTGYFVQEGPLPFGSDYLRSTGGTTLHWLGTCLRMLPADFELFSRHGVGRDWPLSYEQLNPYYEMAERELGVSAEVADQEYLGLWFSPGYVYPMHRIPLSYVDQVFASTLDGRKVALDDTEYELSVTSTPQARNSMPNPAYDGGAGYQPVGAVGAPHTGMRCEGNSSCIPICPVQAKYNALKSLARLPSTVEVRTQCVVTDVVLSAGRLVAGLEYVAYSDGFIQPPPSERVTADVYVLAGGAIENAKLLLASGITTRSDQVGRNLMDHPFMLAWALMPETVGAFRGPSSTSGIESLRDGAFRRDRAAFRTEIANWGWDFAAFSPYSDVEIGVHQNGLFGEELRSWLADRIPRQIRLGFLLEQLPSPGNRVTVSDGYRDALGQPRPVIHYDVDSYTRAGLVAARNLSKEAFKYLEAADATVYNESDAGYVTFRDAGYTYHGSGHCVGTHRMGSSPEDSVVDDRQRCWDHENLYLVGCGSMPTIATSNPTLTMAALAFRTAEGILEDLGS